MASSQGKKRDYNFILFKLILFSILFYCVSSMWQAPGTLNYRKMVSL